MVLGPLEYLVVGFEGDQFTGKILAELRSAPGERHHPRARSVCDKKCPGQRHGAGSE